MGVARRVLFVCVPMQVTGVSHLSVCVHSLQCT